MRKSRTNPAWLASTAISTLLIPLLSGALPAGAVVPTGMHIIAVSSGGHILAGPARGATSPASTFRAGLRDLRAAFGRSPDVLSAARSTDGTLTVALFRVRTGSTPVGGLVLASYVPNGSSHVAVVYDRLDRFATTAPQLIARAAEAAHTRSPGTSIGLLRQMTANDGSVRALVPPSWKIGVFSGGEFSATGPDGAEVDQEVAAHLIDSRSPEFQQALALQRQMNRPADPFGTPFGIPVTYEPDPERAFVAFATTIARAQRMADPAITIERVTPQPPQPGIRVSEIIGTETVRGTRMRFDGIVAASQANSNGAWNISVKMVSAPVNAFARDLPTLAAIYNSYHVDQGVMGQQVQNTIAQDRAGAARGLALMQQTQAQNTATFNASMSHAQAVQSSIDRSTAGFTRYLNGSTVVENSATGAHATVHDGFAEAIIKNDPQSFRVVPESEYRRGTDF